MDPMGRFVWHDLMTTDVEAAASFYRPLTGWETSPGRDGALMIHSHGEEIGRIAPMPSGVPAGIPPHWMGYVATKDVDGIAKQTMEMGGKVLVPGMDIPGVGRFAVLADPQGAVLAVFSTSEEMPPPNRNLPGRFSWGELNTTDWESAWKFYSALFGWKPTHSMDMGPELGQYFMFGTDEKESIGGMSNVAKSMNLPPHWLHYFNVSDIDAAVEQVKAGGGKVLHGPSEIPGNDWIAQCMDPQGAAFAVYASERKQK